MFKFDKNLIDLKGAELSIDGQVIGRLDVVETKTKGGRTISNMFVQGNNWAGEPIATTKDDKLICFKGSIYARDSIAVAQERRAVGSLAQEHRKK